MAYSNSWSEVIPSGGDQAKTADDHLRQVRLDLRERLDDIVGDFTADPIRLIRGTPIHWSLGNVDRDTGSSVFDGSSGGRWLDPNVISGAVIWYLPLLVNPGIVVSQIDFRVYRNTTGAAVDCSFNRIDDGANETIIQTVSSASTGWHTVSLTALATTILVSNVYMLRIVLTSDAVTADSARLLWVNIDP